MYKVLIVEDEDIIRNGLTYMVDWPKLNCIVVGRAADGIEGLAKIKELQPDIVITDVRMPFQDGIQMLKQSKAEHDYEAIIISGYSEFEYAQQAISLSVSEYLLKPIDFDKLHAAMVKIIAKIQLNRQRQNEKKSFEERHLYNELLDIQYLEVRTNKTKYVDSMIEYIKQHYSKKISINDLSASLQISTVYLYSKFKEETSYTFNDFLNRYRMIKAIELLKQGDLLIYEIAERVGFQEYKYFSQVFKKYIGHSPTSFLEQSM